MAEVTMDEIDDTLTKNFYEKRIEVHNIHARERAAALHLFRKKTPVALAAMLL